MGQTLSSPVIEKISSDGIDDRIAYGISSMQGWRISMEDAHAAILDLQVEEDTQKPKPTSSEARISFFGVYDGHGGEKVAGFAGNNIHKIVARQEAFKKGDFEQALKDGFLATDRAILNDYKYRDEVSGCTASVALISKSKIYVGNAGDSRSVLGVKGRAKPLSYDHKPSNDGEKARISAAGGFVEFGRVNGNLALSRAIGDFEFKKKADLSPEQQIVTAFPDVVTHTLATDDEFLVIACDGIWDCRSSQAVVEFVRRGIAAKQALPKICENLMDNCLASGTDVGGVGSDNMTMIIVAILNGKSLDDWYKEIGDRVANGDGPCAPPEYAELRGPALRQRYDRSGLAQEPPSDRPGNIILLGDGRHILTDADDTHMFDYGDEDKDLESQASKDWADVKNGIGKSKLEQEETPQKREKSHSPEPTEDSNPFDTPSSTTSERSEDNSTATPYANVVPETALPTKLFSPAKEKEEAAPETALPTKLFPPAKDNEETHPTNSA